MKRWFSVTALLFCLLLAACGQAHEPAETKHTGTEPTETEHAETEHAEAEHAAVLRVKSNPTTGFSWAAVQDKELFDIQEDYAADAQKEPVTGSGGVQVFTMTPKAAGTARITFTYSRPWEPSDIDPEFTCTFEIGEDLQITVIDDGREQAEERGYSPKIEIR